MPSPVYFPEGRVASRDTSYSPVTERGTPVGVGPRNTQLFQSAPDPPRMSAEQGIGRAPGQQWPHMTQPVQQFDWDALAGIGWHYGNPTGLLDPVEKSGWSMARFYEQSPDGKHVWPVPVAITNPQTRSYTSLASVAPEPTMGGHVLYTTEGRA